MVDKYEFNNIMKDTVPQNTREELFNKFFASEKLQKKHFYNRYYETHSTPEKIATRQLSSKYIESASFQPSKLTLVRNLNSKLGIQNSGQGFNISKENFRNTVPLLMEHVPDMEKLFNAKSESKNPVANFITRLDKVYKDWAGTSITRNAQRVRITGTKKKQTLHSISKEHDQSVEECTKPLPENNQTPGVILEVVKPDDQTQIITVDQLMQVSSSSGSAPTVNINLSQIDHLLNSGTLVRLS